MKTALLILNPRHVERFEESLLHLKIPRIRLSGYTEGELAVHPGPWDDALAAARSEGITHLAATSDDLIIPPDTLRCLETLASVQRDIVWTGWANMDEASSLVGLSDSPLSEESPSLTAYDFPTWRDVLSGPRLRRTFFTGFVGTLMTLDDWDKYPLHAYTANGTTETDYNATGAGHAWASDYHMSRRLHADGRIIMTHRGAFCLHLKSVTGALDPYPPSPRRGVFFEPAPK